VTKADRRFIRQTLVTARHSAENKNQKSRICSFRETAFEK